MLFKFSRQKLVSLFTDLMAKDQPRKVGSLNCSKTITITKTYGLRLQHRIKTDSLPVDKMAMMLKDSDMA